MCDKRAYSVNADASNAEAKAHDSGLYNTLQLTLWFPHCCTLPETWLGATVAFRNHWWGAIRSELLGSAFRVTIARCEIACDTERVELWQQPKNQGCDGFGLGSPSVPTRAVIRADAASGSVRDDMRLWRIGYTVVLADPTCARQLTHDTWLRRENNRVLKVLRLADLARWDRLPLLFCVEEGMTWPA